MNAAGHARLPAIYNSKADSGRGLFLVKVEDADQSNPELVSGVFEFKRDILATPPPPLHIITDKPLYQPGQIIHYAVLAMRQEDLKPLAGEPVTVIIEDARGNQIEKREISASDNGIASGTLPLSRDPNPGEWRIRATARAHTQEKTVTVKRYVRRRLDIQASVEPPYIVPGISTLVKFSLSYFNGKPASGVKLLVKLSCPGVLNCPLDLVVTTDAHGNVSVPINFTPTIRGNAETIVTLEAEASDGGTPESFRRDIPFFHGLIRTAILPENGAVRPGRENRFLLAAWRPDGSPAPGLYRVLQETMPLISSRKKKSTFTVEVGPAGWGVFTLPAEEAALSFLVSSQSTLPVRNQRIHFSPAAGIDIITASKPLRPGDMLEGEMVFEGSRRHEQDAAELTLALPGGTIQPIVPEPIAPGRWRFSTTIPMNTQGGIILFAGLRENGVLSHFRRITLPVAAPLSAIHLTPSRRQVGPGEDVRLAMSMEVSPPDRENAKAAPAKPPVAGAAVVTVVDTSVLARAGGTASDNDAMIYIDSRMLAMNLPPLVENAFRQGLLPFPAMPGDDGAIQKLDNQSRIRQRNILRYDQWRSVIVCIFLSLLSSWILILLAEESERNKHRRPLWRFSCLEALIVVCIIAVIAAVSVPNLMHSRFGPGPDRGVSQEDRDRIAAAPRPALEDNSSIVPKERAREWFPETLAFFPEVIFDAEGRAAVTIAAADSITRWHAGAVGIASAGGMRAGGTNFQTVKSLFIEADFPVAFIEGDRPDLRAAVFANLRNAASIDLLLQESEYYICDRPTQTIQPSGRDWIVFKPRFVKSGECTVGMTAIARDAAGVEVARDVVSIPVTVAAAGREAAIHESGILTDGGNAETVLDLPAEAMRKQYALRVFPTPLSEYLDGVEALLGIPTGCFEQTASKNYPNLLILQYLKHSGKTDPALIAAATDYVRQGYQRLLTFEVWRGGFSLYGNAPASPWLSAYGLMHFRDLEQFIPVDPAVITRTRNYLLETRVTGEQGAYVAWALTETGNDLPPHFQDVVDKGLESASLYERLVSALACLNLDGNHERARAVVLREMRLLSRETPVLSDSLPSSARGVGAETECLALAALAGQKSGQTVPERLYQELARRRSGRGGWPGTQATTLALKALTGGHPGTDCEGTLTASSEGVVLGTFAIGPEARHFTLREPIDGKVRLHYEGKGRLGYLLSARGEMRWRDEELHLDRDGLNLRTALDREIAATGEEIILTASLFDRGDGAENPLLELDLGPALALNHAALDAIVADEESAVLRYEPRDYGVALFLRHIKAGGQEQLRIPLIADKPGAYTLPTSRLWEYYRPENEAAAAGLAITILP